MKCIVFIVAIVALASAIEEKKPKEELKKPEENGLKWPLPDPISEGDLMLHGAIAYERVRALHKAKIEDDADKMILAHGRLFLRRVSKFFDDNGDFKVPAVLCRDSRDMNSTVNRWRIEIPRVIAQASPVDAPVVQRDQPLPKEKVEEAARNNITHDNETEANFTQAPSSTVSQPPTATNQTTERPADNSTTVKPVEPAKPAEESFEVRRRDFYREVGANFARLLMREYRKEALIAQESEYLARFIADEAVHYGAMAIYCNEGENVKEIKKQLVALLDEKA